MTQFNFMNPQIQDNQPVIMDLPDSSGGINTRQQATEIGKNQLTESLNTDLSTPGKIKKRLGRVTVLDNVGNSHMVLGLKYLKAPSVGARMCFVHNKRVYKSTTPLETAGSWVDVDSSDHFTADDTDTVSALIGDEVFFTNGTDNVHSYNGTGISDEGDTNTDPPQAKCMAYFNNRAFMANTTSYPDYVYFSDALDAHTFDRSTNVFKVAPGEGTEITNLIPYQQNSLVIFKEDSIYELKVQGSSTSYWNLRNVEEQYGCVAPQCAIEYHGVIYYFTRDGVRTVPPMENRRPVSYLNKDNFDDINWQYVKQSRAVIFDGKYYLAVPTSSSTYPNKVFVLDLNTGGWTTITGWNVSCWGVFINNNEEVLMAGDAVNGKVYHCYKSSTYNDSGSAVNFQIETREFTFNKPFQYKSGGEFEVEILSSTGNTVTISAAIDGGSYSSLGTCTATDKFHLDNLEEFKRIKFKATNNATSTEQLILGGMRATTFVKPYRSE